MLSKNKHFCVNRNFESHERESIAREFIVSIGKAEQMIVIRDESRFCASTRLNRFSIYRPWARCAISTQCRRIKSEYRYYWTTALFAGTADPCARNARLVNLDARLRKIANSRSAERQTSVCVGRADRARSRRIKPDV